MRLCTPAFVRGGETEDAWAAISESAQGPSNHLRGG
jgi:hypothetical protein